MSIAEASTNACGPATVEIQIEQGCDFEMTVTLMAGGSPIDISGYSFSAEFSPQWTPGAAPVAFTCTPDVDPTTGVVVISLAGSVTLDTNFPLPNPPRKVWTNREHRSRFFALGGWDFYMTDNTGFKRQIFEGPVRFLRNAASGG